MASEQPTTIDLGEGWHQILIENDQLQPYITTRVQHAVMSLAPRRLACFHSSNNLLGKLANITVVNALLAYSRGQLALAPCTDCSHSYENRGSAMPFPDCIFLPTYWGFACASCIANRRAAVCSFQIIRQEYRDRMWERAHIPIDGIGRPGSKWLRRADPLSTYQQAGYQTIWMRKRSEDEPFHDTAQPLQEPSFTFPPDVPNATLPGWALIVDEQLSLLKDKLRARKNIVLITGAGISTNTGIADFQSLSRSKDSSRNVFDASAYMTLESADKLHATVLDMLQRGTEARFTPFDTFAEDLARSGRLRRQYTQNIDGRHSRLNHLSQRTMWLHGRADTLVCHSHPSHTMQVTSHSFEQWVTAPCPTCASDNEQRALDCKRRWSQGFLRPKVLLYGEFCSDESEILAAFNHDLTQPIDAVLIVGTRLTISSLWEFAESLCKAVRARDPENMVVWVNKQPPQLGTAFDSLINFTSLGDCDAFASVMRG